MNEGSPSDRDGGLSPAICDTVEHAQGCATLRYLERDQMAAHAQRQILN
jgi:hypothetical protein